jgi:general secretion pathway protein B
MSYILDALKKSDQERQQGISPHLHSAHGPILQNRNSSSPFKQRTTIWMVSGGVLLVCTCLGILFFQYHHFLAEKDSTKTTDTPLLSAETEKPRTTPPAQPANQDIQRNESSSPQVTVKDQDKVLLSIAVEGSSPDPPAGIETEIPQTSLPLLQELSGTVQAEISNLNFAGHTYAKNPSQRMIIVNGKILREGDMIAPSTYLREITWEGVTIEFNGTRFRVITN